MNITDYKYYGYSKEKKNCWWHPALWYHHRECLLSHMGLPASMCSNRHCHKWEKIRFCRDTIEFVGLKLTLNGIAPSDTILSAIKDFRKPTDLMNAWSWFGLVNQVVWAYSISPIKEPILSLVPTAAIRFVILGNKIWLLQIHHPKFVPKAFPQIAHIQCWAHYLLWDRFFISFFHFL